jgi:DNA-binding NarL/FixJ family response regulator
VSIIRILVADDHPVVRRGLHAVLEAQGWTIVAEAVNGREAVDKAITLRPDVCILDIDMPVLNGLDATRAILQAAGKVRVIVLTTLFTKEIIAKALHIGVRGCLLKSGSETEVVAAVNAVMEGKTFFSSHIPGSIVESLVHSNGNGLNPVLTLRESEIVQLLAEGNSNKEVAGALNISPRTVENHRSHIMQRLEFRSFSELIRYAIRTGMVEP